MNTYTKRIHFKYILFLLAILIGVGSLYYTNQLVKKLANEERKKIELWAEATSLIITSEDEENFNFLIKIIQDNETIPLLLLDADGNIIGPRNIDSTKIANPKYLEKRLERMKEVADPIVLDLWDGHKQYIYYDRSTILTSLTYYPIVQLSVIIVFILVAYFAFSSSRKAEQNQVWVGLSKETAHQLGTPISSLMAWVEIIKQKLEGEKFVDDLEKDVMRLEKITERFSKIGAKPKLNNDNLNDVVQNAVNYLKRRSSSKVEFEVIAPDTPLLLPLNVPLFEWVLENICKNAVDAIDGQGRIKVEITDNNKFAFIDISDTGKGIARSKHKTIFKPGFTTKERGWGLGLSLTKRIVEEYHNGKIFVAESEIGKGTTFRIILNAET